jgi:hypothetical protein
MTNGVTARTNCVPVLTPWYPSICILQFAVIIGSFGHPLMPLLGNPAQSQNTQAQDKRRREIGNVFLEYTGFDVHFS